MAGGPRDATTTERGRVYTWKGETFDSVTTILDRGVPKPQLINWAAKQAARHAVENIAAVSTLVANGDRKVAIEQIASAHVVERDTAASKGTEIHSHVEAHVLGQPIAAPGLSIAKSLASFQRFIDEMTPEFVLSEATVYSRTHHYAGTLDLVLTFIRPDGTLKLVDVKTGRNVYPEVALQLAAYRYADFISMPDGSEIPMPDVDECFVLHLRPRSYKLIPVVADESIFRAFLYAQQVAHFVEHTSREVLGSPVAMSDQPTRIRLAGVSFVDTYPANLLALVDILRDEPMPLEIVRDPGNKFDPQAISIRLNGEHLGFIPKDLAATIAPQIDAGALYAADAMYVAVSPDNPDRLGLEIELTKES